MRTERLEEIRRLDAEASPGPWRWGGQTPRYLELRTWRPGWGACTVMGFRRAGTQNATPIFVERTWRSDEPGFLSAAATWAVREVPYRDDVVAIDHPDARFIADARQAISDLLAEVDRLREMITEDAAP